MNCKKCEYDSFQVNDNNKEKKDYINYQTIKKKISIVLLLFIIFFTIQITSEIIHLSYENAVNSCIEKNGHTECGLGSLCDSDCFPSFYLTHKFIYAFLIIANFCLIIPTQIVLIIIFIVLNIKKSKIKLNN